MRQGVKGAESPAEPIIRCKQVRYWMRLINGATCVHALSMWLVWLRAEGRWGLSDGKDVNECTCSLPYFSRYRATPRSTASGIRYHLEITLHTMCNVARFRENRSWSSVSGVEWWMIMLLLFCQSIPNAFRYRAGPSSFRESSQPQTYFC